jgi:DNA-3-methyladenine glycosylase II
MTITVSITPDTPFSLAAAASFGFGPNTGRPRPDGAEMRLAFVTDDLHQHAGVHLKQEGDAITATIDSAAPPDTVVKQIRRVLSLDRPGDAWLAVGHRDPVIGRLQDEHSGLRPVLFHSPYEAAAWSIITARRRQNQSAALRTRLSASAGRTMTIAGETRHAFPTPEQLLAVPSFPSIEPVRMQRLHAVARAALQGRLEADSLRDLAPDQALTQLQSLPGIGPTYANLILLRSTGATDVMTFHEPRLPSYAAQVYGLGHTVASRAELTELSERWRPYRTWCAVLIRVAGDRAGLEWAAGRPRGRR